MQKALYIVIAVLFVSEIAMASFINKKRRELDTSTEDGLKKNKIFKLMIAQLFVSFFIISAVLLYMF